MRRGAGSTDSTEPQPAIERRHLVADTVRAGLLARVTGERGTFRILADTENQVSGSRWTEVYGPLGSGHAMYRSFVPERVRPLAKRQDRRP